MKLPHLLPTRSIAATCAWVASAAVVSGFAGCSPNPEGGTGGSTEPGLDPATVLVDEQDCVEAAAVEEDSVELELGCDADQVAIGEGSIVVGSTPDGQGYLRRVVAADETTDGDLLLTTENATIADALVGRIVIEGDGGGPVAVALESAPRAYLGDPETFTFDEALVAESVGRVDVEVGLAGTLTAEAGLLIEGELDADEGSIETLYIMCNCLDPPSTSRTT